MVIRYFKNYLPIVLILTLFTGMLVFLRPLVAVQGDVYLSGENAMPLFGILSKLLVYRWIYVLFVCLLLIILANLMIRLNLKYFFIEERTYLPALFFLLLGGIAFFKTGFHPGLVALLFLFFIIDKIFNSLEEPDKLSLYFDAGLLLATGSLFYGNLIFFLLFVLLGFFLLNTLNFRKILVITTGVLCVYFITVFYYFFTDSLPVLWNIIQHNFLGSLFELKLHLSLLIFLIYIGFLSLIAFLNLLSRYNLKKVVARKYINVLVALMICIILFLFFVPGFTFASAYFLAVPLSFLLADYFIHIRTGWFAEVLFGLLLVTIVFVVIQYPV